MRGLEIVTESAVDSARGYRGEGPCEKVCFRLYYRIEREEGMRDTAQERALQNYRRRLVERGMTRFEVLGLTTDRELVRSIAKILAEPGGEAIRIRSTLHGVISGEPAKKGGVLAALLRSPLVGADLVATRSVADDRKVDL